MHFVWISIFIHNCLQYDFPLSDIYMKLIMGLIFQYLLIDGETWENNLRKGGEWPQQSQGNRRPEKMVPLQPLRASATYHSINPVNHFNFMNKTLLGRLWSPIAKWFTIIEMRFHLDIFRQQGLVTHISCRPLKIGFFISTSTSEEVCCLSILPEKRKIEGI